MTTILGLSAFYHDSAAALLVDGELVAAAQEERFSRRKHDASFPRQAIDACLRQTGLTAEDLDHVGFYEKPLTKFDRLIETYLSFAPAGFRSFRTALPDWLNVKLNLRRHIRRGLNHRYRRGIVFCQHHQSHAASAFFPSPFDEAAILTIDGVGEWATATMGSGHGNRIRLSDEIRFPHSLGLLYSAFTSYCGFRVNSGEAKLMGLAPYGEPKYVDTIKRHLIRIHPDGSFHLNLDYFGYCQGLRMTNRRFHRLFGRGPREPESEIEQLDKDLAASIQRVSEEVLLKIAVTLRDKTGLNQLCLAGGVALNCVANGRLLREGPFDDLWIQPAAGDAGGAIGVAMLIWHQLLGHRRIADGRDRQRGSLLGPQFETDEIRAALDAAGAVYEVIPDRHQRNRRVATLLAAGHVVGRFDGRAEFGPRALGNRSILGDPRRSDMQSTMNLKIKFRESFRPFAPAILKEHAFDFFALQAGVESPYMLLTCAAKTDALPAVTHVDGSARIQTVDAETSPGFASLLQTFYRQTGCPALINTSFNVRGEPIVGSPADAYRCFLHTGMDALVIGEFLLVKASQSTPPTAPTRLIPEVLD